MTLQPAGPGRISRFRPVLRDFATTTRDERFVSIRAGNHERKLCTTLHFYAARSVHSGHVVMVVGPKGGDGPVSFVDGTPGTLLAIRIE